MLTREHAIAEFDFRSGRIIPDHLVSKRDAAYLDLAAEMLEIYRDGVGERRIDLHRKVEALFYGMDCPPRRVASFCKLLDDVCEYDRSGARKAVKLRNSVFSLAATRHPLVAEPDELFESAETKVKREIAEKLGKPWREIADGMFSDVIEFNRLKKFEGYASPAALLRRYNVAQIQATLYDATQMRVWVSGDYKTVLRYAKLALLMHDIVREGNGYRFTFTGPASVLRESRRYGIQMAKFLPALLACGEWRMEADIQRFAKGRPLRLALTDRDGFRSDRETLPEFDSSVEEAFATKWGDGERDGWRLERESEILVSGQRVFTPDFAFRHSDGRVVLMEIVGFWTPEYLEEKRKTLELFRRHRILLALQEKAAACLGDCGFPSVTYGSGLKLAAVIEGLSSATER